MTLGVEMLLQKAAIKDLPIFVICHYVFENTHGLPETWSDDLIEALDGSFSKGMNENSLVYLTTTKTLL